MFFVRDASRLQPDSPPAIGETFSGERVDFTVQNLIDAEGERVPAAKNAPKRFRMAFVLLGKKGSPPSAAAIAKLKKIAKQWVQYFRVGTDGNGSVKTKLKVK